VGDHDALLGQNIRIKQYFPDRCCRRSTLRTNPSRPGRVLGRNYGMYQCLLDREQEQSTRRWHVFLWPAATQASREVSR